MDAADGLSHGMPVSTHAADHLTGVAAVATVDIDEIITSAESLVAELACPVVVYAAEQDHHFRSVPIPKSVGLPQVRRNQRHQLRERLDEIGDVFCFHTKDCGIAFCQNTGFVFSEIRRDKILPVKVLQLHNVPIADDETCRPIKHVQQAKEIGRDIAAGPSRAQHHDLDRAIHREFHHFTSARRSMKPRFFSTLTLSFLRMLTCSSHSLGNWRSNPSTTVSGSMGTKLSPQKMRALISG